MKEQIWMEVFFKAVFVPYAVNLALDDDTSDFVKKRIKKLFVGQCRSIVEKHG